MKELTPNGWIGVLIGIVVFGSIVDPVTGAAKCWKAAPSVGKPTIESSTEMETAYDISKWQVTCTGSNKCLQYHPPTSSSAGIMKLAVECGLNCNNPRDGPTRIGTGYLCHSCDTDGDTSGCKKYNTDVRAHGKPCHTYTGPKNGGDILNAKNILCLDKCKYHEPSSGDITVGCESDINLLTGGTKTDCTGSPADCASVIFGSKCWKDAANPKNPKIDSVTDIKDAFNRAKWNILCSNTNHQCLQYWPDTSKHAKGKVQIVVECGDSCSSTNADTRMGVVNQYKCTQCNTKTTTNCVGLIEAVNLVKADNECNVYTGEKNSLAKLNEKIFCLDNCAYLAAGNTITVKCAGDFSPGSSTNCPPEDKSCDNMILKSGSQGGGSTNNQGGGSTNNQGGGSTNNQGATATPTPARRHGNRVTVPTCLIGSMAILLFATSQYVTILN